MHTQLTRRRWLQACGGTLGAGLVPVTALGVQTGPVSEPQPDKKAADSFPQQPPDLVRETVGASHRDLGRVKELVTAYPELAKASWDWGFGDWESPLEAASHTGQREIALFLMEHGARPNLFTFAMLGELAIVKAVLAVQPEHIKTPGPHGLSLLHHARVGEERSKPVLDYLTSLGAPDNAASSPPKEVADALIGEYKAAGEDITLILETNRQGQLGVKANGGSLVRLTKFDEGVWHPAGAPSVRLHFEPADGKATALTLTMGGRTLRAQRAS
jgi:hypothetical protein